MKIVFASGPNHSGSTTLMISASCTLESRCYRYAFNFEIRSRTGSFLSGTPSKTEKNSPPFPGDHREALDRTESILQATSDHPDFQLVGLTLAVDILERSNLLAQQHSNSSHLQTGDDHYTRWGRKLGLQLYTSVVDPGPHCFWSGLDPYPGPGGPK